MSKLSAVLVILLIAIEALGQTTHTNPKIFKGKILKSKKVVNLQVMKPYLYFKIEDRPDRKGRAIVLFRKNDLLNYAFIDSVGVVEFSYPIETDEETRGFIMDTAKSNLSILFANKSADYRVYELPDKIGVEATIGGILYEQIGVLSSKKGSLRELIKAKLDNLIIR